MPLPATLHERVRTLEQEIDRYNGYTSSLVRDKKVVQKEYDTQSTQLTWKEKYFWGIFGNKELINEVSRLEQILSGYNEQISHSDSQAKGLNSEVNNTLTTYLIKNDKPYQDLHGIFAQVQKVRKGTHDYLHAINSALSEIDDAQSMEVLDFVSSNKGISILSHIENEEASDAIHELRRKTPQFQESIIAYHKYFKTYNFSTTELEFDTNIDLAFDLIFDGFDFMSYFVLERLDAAESNIRNLHSNVTEIKERIDLHYQKAEKNLRKYLQGVRASII